jgi:3-hydroxyisobutyrate dehydrogenase-like beta-hydroxyacid dehydrogenase
MTKVGFIGLGAMGLPMAKRIVAAGYPVCTTFHKSRRPADELASLGATVADTPAEVARQSEVVITILPADAEVDEVALGSGGLIEGLSAGAILIEMTSASPASVRRLETELRHSSCRVLDAPVSGGTTGAARGTLTIMAGGDPSLLEECRPLLSCMGSRIVHVGAVGQGKVVKMINQMLAALHLVAIGEAFALGVKCGADPGTLYQVIKDSSGYSKVMDLRLPGFLLEGSFEPGFKLSLMKKDVDIALQEALDAGVPLLLGSTTAQLLAATVAAGHADADYSVAAQFIADWTGARLAKPPAGDAVPAGGSA